MGGVQLRPGLPIEDREVLRSFKDETLEIPQLLVILAALHGVVVQEEVGELFGVLGRERILVLRLLTEGLFERLRPVPRLHLGVLVPGLEHLH